MPIREIGGKHNPPRRPSASWVFFEYGAPESYATAKRNSLGPIRNTAANCRDSPNKRRTSLAGVGFDGLWDGLQALLLTGGLNLSSIVDRKIPNMVAFQTLRSLSRDLSLALQVDDVGSALVTAARHPGLSEVIIAELPERTVPLRPALAFSTLPNVEPDMLSLHPLVAQARQTDAPFGLAEAYRKSARTADEWCRGLPQGFDGLDGAIIPIHEDGSLAWWICFAGQQPGVDRLKMCMLAAASYAARARATALANGAGAKQLLTTRETACLRVAAIGKSDAEIGHTLGISGRTMRFHITNAKEKLGAKSRIQAIAYVLGVD